MRKIDDYVKRVDSITPEQAVQVAKVIFRYATGGYPPDITVRRYRSLVLDDDTSAPTRPDLIGLVGRNEVAIVWSRLAAADKDRILNPRRHTDEAVKGALARAWTIFLTLGSF